MTGSTHVAVGVASSLIVLQPKTVPECLCALTGGIIGGMISDIDSPGKRKTLDYSDDPYGWQIGVFVVLFICLLLGLDYMAGNGAVEYLLTHMGVPLFIGGIAFIGISLYGTRTIHRTFMHSFLAGIALSVSMWFFCRPLAEPFAIGFISHMLIDFFNRKKVQYFWPIPVKIGLNRYPSDGKLNRILGATGALVSIFLFVYFFINSFAASTLLPRTIKFFSMPISIKNYITVPMIVPYLIIINVISFVVYFLDYHLFMNSIGFYRGSDEDAYEMSEFIMTLLLVIDISGGMIGKILAVLVLIKGKFYKAEQLANFNLYVIPICLLVSWIFVLSTFLLPVLIPWARPIASICIGLVPVRYLILLYFLIINIITMTVFPKVKRFAIAITPREKWLFILSILGGASGAYFAMKTTGNHENAVLFSETLPDIITMHAIVLTCVFFMA